MAAVSAQSPWQLVLQELSKSHRDAPKTPAYARRIVCIECNAGGWAAGSQRRPRSALKLSAGFKWWREAWRCSTCRERGIAVAACVTTAIHGAASAGAAAADPGTTAVCAALRENRRAFYNINLPGWARSQLTLARQVAMQRNPVAFNQRAGYQFNVMDAWGPQLRAAISSLIDAAVLSAFFGDRGYRVIAIAAIVAGVPYSIAQKWHRDHGAGPHLALNAVLRMEDWGAPLSTEFSKRTYWSTDEDFDEVMEKLGADYIDTALGANFGLFDAYDVHRGSAIGGQYKYLLTVSFVAADIGATDWQTIRRAFDLGLLRLVDCPTMSEFAGDSTRA